MQFPSDSLEHLIQSPYLEYGAIVLVLLILLYVYQIGRTAMRGIVPFKTQGGTIEIAPSTLRGVIQHAATSVEGVEKAACHHFVKGSGVGVRVAIHMRANRRLKDIETGIKRRIRATLLDQFGMENVEPIHIRVTRIVGDPVASKNNTLEEEDPLEREAGLIEPEENSALDDDRPYASETRL